MLSNIVPLHDMNLFKNLEQLGADQDVSEKEEEIEA